MVQYSVVIHLESTFRESLAIACCGSLQISRSLTSADGERSFDVRPHASTHLDFRSRRGARFD